MFNIPPARERDTWCPLPKGPDCAGSVGWHVSQLVPPTAGLELGHLVPATLPLKVFVHCGPLTSATTDKERSLQFSSGFQVRLDSQWDKVWPAKLRHIEGKPAPRRDPRVCVLKPGLEAQMKQITAFMGEANSRPPLEAVNPKMSDCITDPKLLHTSYLETEVACS